MIKLVVLDFDYTLVGSEIGFYEAKAHKKEEFERRNLWRVAEGLTHEYGSIFRVAEELKMDVEDVEKVAEEIELERMKASYLIEGARELLSFLKQRGIKIALLTGNCRKAVLYALERHGIGGYFDTVLTRDGCAPEDMKPSPRCYLKLLEELGVREEEALLIGDSEADLLPVKSVRVIVGDKVKGDYNVRDLREAVRLLKRLTGEVNGHQIGDIRS
ncbi:HAD family hydrolase [Thermococcus sp.]